MRPELTADEFRKFQEFIYKSSGIRTSDTKLTLLSNRIRRRLEARKLATFQAYYQFLTSPAGKEELEAFLDAITTNETFFFRTEKHFEWFETEFISEMIRRPRPTLQKPSLRIWSAACSTGEEPYSLAICLAKNQLRLSDWTLEIVGTDISEQALQSARAGVYSQRAIELVQEVHRRRYFLPTDTSWQIRPAVKELVRFQSHNLMLPIRLPPFDCIFLRNVLIYFDRDSKRKVIENLVKALNPQGYLVVGPSEGIFDMLEMLTKRSMFLYQKA